MTQPHDADRPASIDALVVNLDVVTNNRVEEETVYVLKIVVAVICAAITVAVVVIPV